MQCNRKFKCGHRCNGLCGEYCPPCIECYYDEMKDGLEIMGELDYEDLIYILPECKHVFPVSFLDK